MDQFPPAYNPQEFEADIYKQWEASGYFNPDKNKELRSKNKGKRKPFSIVLPPPNVTGTLHLGHATMLAIEDLLIRYHRMNGDDTVWIPGTDHAAIATQNVVEKKIWDEEKKTRHDLGREVLLKKIEAFVDQSKETIHRQMRKMGASLDWSREAYTLDAPREHAVRTVFKMMYDDGLIYRGDRIVNWCTRCQSTLADDEVNYREEKTKFYYLKYGPVVIGTARPETKFLDKIIIVHPNDKRYANIVGTSFDVEWIDGKVKATVVADASAQMDMGSGAMTITPAHSFVDFELAQKYNLEVHQIINEQGELTQAAGVMAGMPVTQARQKVIERLQEKGLVDHIDENYVHNLSVCYRCGRAVEPLVSKQWFVNVNKKSGVRSKKLEKLVGKKKTTLKELSIAVVKKGAIEILPDRFEKIYFNWMNNLHDWCISRQIWFGHRIPVWYCRREESRSQNRESRNDKRGDNLNSRFQILDSNQCPPIVSIDTPTKCPHCGNINLEQDPDTLDTWFSSGLWTFSTLGWPEDTNDLKRFHPTSVLETGYDIIFFWVARMILMTTYTLGDIPFKTVYLHGLVRDEQGRKMSKSLNNGIDPLVVSEKYGTDAVRLSLVVGTTPGNDTNLGEKKIEGYRNFVNKLWNIARYVESQRLSVSIEGLTHGSATLKPKTLADRWILSRLQHVVTVITEDLEHYRLSQAAETLRAFTWNELADWYLEISKLQLQQPTLESSTRFILSHVVNIVLKLWHPFTPFVTEAIWQKILDHASTSLMISAWPHADKKLMNTPVETMYDEVKDIVTAIRQVRSAYHVSPAAVVPVVMVTQRVTKSGGENQATIEHLAKVTISIAQKKPDGMISAHPRSSRVSVFIDLGNEIDLTQQQQRVEQSIKEVERHIASLANSLTSKDFVAKAPKDVVRDRRTMLKTQQARLKELHQELKELHVMKKGAH